MGIAAIQRPLPGLSRLGHVSAALLAWPAPERSAISDVLALAELTSRSRLLDVGCGSGHLLAWAARREPGAVLVGVEPDVDLVKLARGRMRGAPTRAEIHRSKAETLPFADDTFDVATCTMLLQRLALVHRRAVLRESHRVLQPGGRMLIADWRPPSTPVARLLEWVAAAVRTALLGRGREAADLVAELEEQGFERIERVFTRTTVGGPLEILRAYKPLM